VNPAELAELLAGFAEDAEDSSVEAQLVDATGETVGTVEDLIGSGRDADGPGGAGRHRAGGGRGLVADGRVGVGVDGDINGDLAEEFSVAVENLYAAVAAIGDVDVALRVECDAVRRVQLARLVAGFAPGLEPIAVLVHFGDARIDIAVADVGVASGVPSDVGDLAKHSINRRERGLGMLQRGGAFVGSFLLAAEDHEYAAFGIELDDHVRAFVGDPDVVVFVDFDGVGEGPGVEMVADLPDEFSVGGEFEELRGCGSKRGAGGIAARENEDVAFGIYGNADGFAEVEVGRKFQEIGDGTEMEFGWLLGEKRSR